jgi:hypothetical protein
VTQQLRRGLTKLVSCVFVRMCYDIRPLIGDGSLSSKESRSPRCVAWGLVFLEVAACNPTDEAIRGA